MASEKLVGVLLVGAEGCSESEGVAWLRDASEVEKTIFEKGVAQRCAEGGHPFNVRDLYVDGIGRPYWLKAVLEHPELPKDARARAEQYTRVVRLVG
jgi:hypothetical protein